MARNRKEEQRIRLECLKIALEVIRESLGHPAGGDDATNRLETIATKLVEFVEEK